MFCSTIIPTIGRPTLSKAVYSVLEQSFAADNFEVIVVNDTGRPLPEAGWQTSNKVQVITTNQRERSVARNTGAAIARGKYLHFLDDDDWLLPGALEHFWALSRQAGDAVWLYGGTQIVDTAGECFGELDLVLSGKMHLAIACLGQATPVACISYQDKFEGLFQQFDLENMIIEPTEAFQPGRLADFLWPLIEKRKEIRHHIQLKLPYIQQLAQANFE